MPALKSLVFSMVVSGAAVERDDIKKAVRDRTIRFVIATDAACEGLISKRRPQKKHLFLQCDHLSVITILA